MVIRMPSLPPHPFAEWMSAYANVFIGLCLIGAIEAVVLWHRYRSANGDNGRASALWTFATCAVRVAFVAGLVDGLDNHHWAVLLVAYALPAALVTWGLHRWSGKKLL